MVAIPWRTGVNVRAFAYYGTRYLPFASADLQREQLAGLRDLKAKVVRLFASRNDFSAAESIQQLRAALDRVDEFDMEAIVCLDDSLTGEGFFIPGTEQFHNQVDGHLGLNYWLEEKYNETYMPHARAIAEALNDHPALVMWELGNEYALHPRPSAAHPEIPEPRAEHSEAFLRFARRASEMLKEICPDVLVSTGLINSRQVASLVDDDLDDFAQRLYGIETIDAVSLHYYSEKEGDFGEKQFAMHDLKAAKALGKPVYVGEIGTVVSRPNRPDFFRQEFQEWRQRADSAEISVFCVLPWAFDTSTKDVGVSDKYAWARVHPDFDVLAHVVASFSADVPRWRAFAATSAGARVNAGSSNGSSNQNGDQHIGENLLQNPDLTGFPPQPVTFPNNGSTGNIEWPDQWQILRRDKEGFPPPESYHRDAGYEISAGSREWEMGYSQQVQVSAGQRYRLRAALTPQLGRFDDNPIHGPFLQWRFEVRGDGLELSSKWTGVEAEALKQRQEHTFEFEWPGDSSVTVAFMGRGLAWDYIYNLFVHRIEMVALEQAPVRKTQEAQDTAGDGNLGSASSEPAVPELAGGAGQFPSEGWRNARASRVGAGATLVRPTPSRSGEPVGAIDMDLPVEYAPDAKVPDTELAGRFWIPVRTAEWSGWVRDDVITFVDVAAPEPALKTVPKPPPGAGSAVQPQLIQFAFFGSETDALTLRQKIASAPQAFSTYASAFVAPAGEKPAIVLVPNHVDGIDMNAIPERDALFQRLPLDLEQIQWFQYFGNNIFAFNLRRDGDFSYNFSQGLHGGLDFGNDTPGIVVRAGISGTVKSVNLNASVYQPNYITLTPDSGAQYTIFYGHLVNLRPLAKGAAVSPDTELGEIDSGPSREGHMNHLHLEVRLGNWIINPLLLMPLEVRDPLLAKFQPFDRYFYRSDTWMKWQEPLDQPALKLSRKDTAKIIGPHAVT